MYLGESKSPRAQAVPAVGAGTVGDAAVRSVLVKVVVRAVAGDGTEDVRVKRWACAVVVVVAVLKEGSGVCVALIAAPIAGEWGMYDSTYVVHAGERVSGVGRVRVYGHCRVLLA